MFVWALINNHTRRGVSVSWLQGLRGEEAFEEGPEAALVPHVRHSASIRDLT